MFMDFPRNWVPFLVVLHWISEESADPSLVNVSKFFHLIRSRCSLDQVQNHKKNDPDSIHEMPVELGGLERKMIAGADTT